MQYHACNITDKPRQGLCKVQFYISLTLLQNVYIMLNVNILFHVPGVGVGMGVCLFVCVCVCVCVCIIFAYLELHAAESFSEANTCPASHKLHSHIWKESFHYARSSTRPLLIQFT
jgi:hypothetical protein